MRRAIAIGSGVLLFLSVAGFITSFVLNAFFLDDYGAYGEVPIPGTKTLHLPAGYTTVSFHTQVIGSPSGGGLPVPDDLGFRIKPPEGVADPDVTSNVGGTTTVNNDSRRQLWVIHILKEGNYTVKTEGTVNGFISPRLAFGHLGSSGYLPWVFAGLFGVSLLALLASRLLPRRRQQDAQPFPAQPFPAPSAPVELYASSDEGVRIQQLKTLTSLHDSGALTDEEFEAEKRRVLDGK